MKKFVSLFVLICIFFCFVSCNQKSDDDLNRVKYNSALELLSKKEYASAYQILKELGDYEDAKQKIESFRYVPVTVTYSEEDETACDEFFYNEDNWPIQVISTYSDGNKSIYDYTYDANGNMIKEVSTYSDGDKTIRDYTYDTNGNMIKEVYTYSDGDKTIRDYTYDANGNMIKEVSTYSDGSTESIDVEYKLVYIPYDVTEQIEEIINFDY